MDAAKFNLKVMARDGVIFEGQADSISSYNNEGKFDVLAQHANFISLITRGLLLRIGDEERKIDFDNALLRVRKNNVEVYVGVEGISPGNLPASDFAKNL